MDTLRPVPIAERISPESPRASFGPPPDDGRPPRWTLDGFDRGLPCPEPPGDRPTPADLRLRRRVDAMTDAERRHLTELDLAGDTATLRDLSPLAELPALQRLSLSAAGPVVDLAPIAAAGRLRELSLAGRAIADLRPLGDLGDLRILQIDKTRATDLSFARALTAIEEIVLDGCPGIDDLSALAELPALHTLIVCGVPVRNLAPLGAMAALRHLWIECAPEMTNLEIVGELTELRTLEVDRWPWPSLDALSRLTALERLWVCESPAVVDASAVAGFCRLAYWDLTGTSVEDEWLRAGPRELRAPSSSVRG